MTTNKHETGECLTCSGGGDRREEAPGKVRPHPDDETEVIAAAREAGLVSGEAIDQHCPKCEARPGEMCRSAGGGTIVPAHAERVSSDAKCPACFATTPCNASACEHPSKRVMTRMVSTDATDIERHVRELAHLVAQRDGLDLMGQSRLGGAIRDAIEPRPADPFPENSVCAERSEPAAQARTIAEALLAQVDPTLILHLEGELAKMGDEVRVQERERIAAWLRGWAADAKKDHDAEISVYVPPTLQNVADRIERGEHAKESTDAG